MIRIKFPEPSFKIKKDKSRELIFDRCRKLWVELTPEEWVRQNFLEYLMQVKLYPCTLIAVEKEIMLGELKKRFDIVVFKNAAPWMLVECKEMNEAVKPATIEQILRYNISLNVRYLVLTNGKTTFALHLKNGSFEWLNELPEFT